MVVAVRQTWWRDLRPEEEKIAFAAIEDKLEAAAAKLHQRLSEILGEVRDGTIAVALGVSNQKDWNQLKTIVLDPVKIGDYRKAVKDQLNVIYQFSKARAAEEFGIIVPVTSAGFVQWMESKSRLLAGIHSAVLTHRVQSLVLGDAAGADLATSISRVMDDFAENELLKGADLTATLALQAGREDVHKGAADLIERFTWSALLDRSTCPVCRFLDGVTWWAGDVDIIKPPIHFWCRCILVGTWVTAIYKPKVTGLPDGYELPLAHKRFVERLGGYYA